MKIAKYIDEINAKGEKVLSVFLTAGYPQKNTFVDLAADILKNGADMLELGVPFSDPLADGPVIQTSSTEALLNGVTLTDVLGYVKEIKSKIDKPIILMSYINPILNYGIEKFLDACKVYGVDGLILPDLVIEEYNELLGDINPDLDIVLLCTPTTPDDRIKQIDEQSMGFVYCVSLNGTTGVRNRFDETILKPIQNAKQLITKNKMLVGFGISNEESVKYFAPYCDGVIVGSAVVKLLTDESCGKEKAIELVKILKSAC